MPDSGGSRRSADELYEEVAAAYGAALARLAGAYEADPEIRRDLIQDIHVAVWRSLARFEGRCSLRTWIYRVAHNTATSHVIRRRPRRFVHYAAIEDLPAVAEPRDDERELDERRTLERLLALVHTLTPPDRQVIVLYLEGESAASIADVTGLTSSHVATKIHRIKQLLVERFYRGAGHDA
jgi:RNA polymerase sigma-70 factor (ECF subfamily)